MRRLPDCYRCTGHFTKATKDSDFAVFMELQSECDLSGGYTVPPPKTFSEKMNEAAKAAQCDIWALHADHIIG